MSVFFFAPVLGAVLATIVPFRIADEVAQRFSADGVRKVALWGAGGGVGAVLILAAWLIGWAASRPAGDGPCPDIGASPPVYTLVMWLLIANGVTAAVAGWSAESKNRSWAIAFAGIGLVVVIAATFIGVTALLCDPS